MSQKQTDHRNHYVNSLVELPEDETTIPSFTTPIEQLDISLLDDEVKIPDSGEGEGEDETTPEEMKIQFFSLIADLQRQYPGYTSTDFKKYLEEDAGMAEQLQILKDNFHETFREVDKSDPEYINLLIGMNSIGIEISKDEVDEGEDEGDEGDEDEDKPEDEGEDALAKSIIKMKIEKTDV